MFGKKRNKNDDADFGDVFVVASTPGAYLGTLTATAAQLPDGFAAWERACEEALAKYASGEVSRTAALTRMSALVLEDSSGAEWTLGAATGQWFTRTAGSDWAAGAFPSLPTFDSPPDWGDDEQAAPTEVAVDDPDLDPTPPPWASAGAADADTLAALTDDTPALLSPREGSLDAAADALVADLEQFANTGATPTGPRTADPGSVAEAPSDLPAQEWHSPYTELGWADPPARPPWADPEDTPDGGNL